LLETPCCVCSFLIRMKMAESAKDNLLQDICSRGEMEEYLVL
jgi:hypothetical protein